MAREPSRATWSPRPPVSTTRNRDRLLNVVGRPAGRPISFQGTAERLGEVQLGDLGFVALDRTGNALGQGRRGEGGDEAGSPLRALAGGGAFQSVGGVV